MTTESLIKKRWPPICPVCGEEGHLVYRSPGSPKQCENNHPLFDNIEQDPTKEAVWAWVANNCKLPKVPLPHQPDPAVLAKIKEAAKGKPKLKPGDLERIDLLVSPSGLKVQICAKFKGFGNEVRLATLGDDDRDPRSAQTLLMQAEVVVEALRGFYAEQQK